MVESISYASSREGLTSLSSFLEGKSRYEDVPPFILPLKYRKSLIEGDQFKCYLGEGANRRELVFYLSRKQIGSLRESVFIFPHKEDSRGKDPYYWLNLHATPEADISPLTSCRLRPEDENKKIDFQLWHSLEEQLMVDYILGINNIRFSDLLPFNIVFTRQTRSYFLGGGSKLSVRFDEKWFLQDGDILRFVPRDDDQHLYEWFDILKARDQFSEERWPLISSYRILAEEHRIYSKDWVGSERQLLLDRIQGRPGIVFKNLRPIKAIPVKDQPGAQHVHFGTAYSPRHRKRFSVQLFIQSGLLNSGEETITVPKQDEQELYEWLELYRFDPIANGPTGDVITSGRITKDGIQQKGWLGIEKQLLKDYVRGLISFEHLKPIPFKIVLGNEIALQVEEKIRIRFVPSRRFGLVPGDVISLVPEKETEEGTDFLLIKGDATLARYRLNLQTKEFLCVDYLIDINVAPEGWLNISSTAKLLKRTKETVVNYAKRYRQNHNDWFKSYRDNEAHRWGEHYSPQLVDELKKILSLGKEQLWINKLQERFIEKFPEFEELLVTEKAKAFILDRVKNRKMFTDIFGKFCLYPKVPFFEGSWRIATKKLCSAWGIEIDFSVKQDDISPEDADKELGWLIEE